MHLNADDLSCAACLGVGVRLTCAQAQRPWRHMRSQPCPALHVSMHQLLPYTLPSYPRLARHSLPLSLRPQAEVRLLSLPPKPDKPTTPSKGTKPAAKGKDGPPVELELKVGGRGLGEHADRPVGLVGGRRRLGTCTSSRTWSAKTGR